MAMVLMILGKFKEYDCIQNRRFIFLIDTEKYWQLLVRPEMDGTERIKENK
jgi:hypothetical protein